MANAQPPILEARNITKRFPGVVALNDVSIQFLPGEVHAVVGENGAGKSTLMKILAGAYTPDEGELFFQGKAISFSHPREAQEAGISIIYQEFNLLPERTVAQNIFLGREPSRYGIIDKRQLMRQTQEVLQRIGAEAMISPDAEVKTLSIAQQQLVEIAKALSFDSKVLIMDEPTAALAMHEVEILTRLIHKLIANGMAVIFISHRFTEVFDLARTVTVLKDGQHVATVAADAVTPSQVITMMVGRELDQYFPELASPDEVGEVALQVVNGSNAKLHNINLTLRAGEIVGVSGLQGSGRTELAQAIFGVEPFTNGRILVRGTERPIKSPKAAINLRMGFVTEDRKAEGIFPNQPLNDNILASVRALQAILRRIKRFGTAEKPQLVPELVQQVDVRTPSILQEVQYLSGGNQQKVVLAKWLASTCDLLIFDEPTRGIDVDAKASIHEMIRDLAKAGTAVLMISSELPEVIGMSDRIVVMWDGRISGELPAGAGEEAIMLLATGHQEGTGSTPTPLNGKER
ncbi:MAG: sugar ABC transporter ATP-binding protein [Candidatus Promineifilaceae bacterium]